MKHYVFGKFRSWLVSWVKLLCALVGIFTLGFVIPDWDTDLQAEFLIDYIIRTTKEK